MFPLFVFVFFKKTDIYQQFYGLTILKTDIYQYFFVFLPLKLDYMSKRVLKTLFISDIKQLSLFDIQKLNYIDFDFQNDLNVSKWTISAAFLSFSLLNLNYMSKRLLKVLLLFDIQQLILFENSKFALQQFQVSKCPKRFKMNDLQRRIFFYPVKNLFIGQNGC